MIFNPWVKPFVRENIVLSCDDAQLMLDKTNRDACAQANARNAAIALHANLARCMDRPYYHYDAVSGRLLKFTTPAPKEKPE